MNHEAEEEEESNSKLSIALDGMNSSVSEQRSSSPMILDKIQQQEPTLHRATELSCSIEAELIEYRGQQIAAFQSDDDLLLCLPQAYELFLKRLVSGLHTVYTKLKRLDIMPTVCNVEQVRALRSIGAIQPGVNRCKLISCTDFDLLYEDCASSCSRPGRPPKRSHIYQSQVSRVDFSDPYAVSSIFNANKRLRPDFLSHNSLLERDTKVQKDDSITSDEHDSPGISITNSATSEFPNSFGAALNGNGLSQQMFPFFPIAAQQLMFNQLMTAVGQKPMTIPWTTSTSTSYQTNSEIESPSSLDMCPLSFGRLYRTVSKEEIQNEKKANCTSRELNCEPAKQPTVTDALSNIAKGFSLEQILISLSGMADFALTAVRRQDEQFQKEKDELVMLLEEEKRKRIQAEFMLREKERVHKNCVIRIRSLKTIINQLKSTCTNGINSALEIPEEPWEDYLTISGDKDNAELNEQKCMKNSSHDVC